MHYGKVAGPAPVVLGSGLTLKGHRLTNSKLSWCLRCDSCLAPINAGFTCEFIVFEATMAYCDNQHLLFILCLWFKQKKGIMSIFKYKPADTLSVGHIAFWLINRWSHHKPLEASHATQTNSSFPTWAREAWGGMARGHTSATSFLCRGPHSLKLQPGWKTLLQ